MAERECPPQFAGKSLRELNLRANHGMEVILIRPSGKRGKEAAIVAFPDYRLSHGDVILVTGKQTDVEPLG